MMTSRACINTAMRLGIPDYIPYWCLLSLQHIIKNSQIKGQLPERAEVFVRAECELTKRYGFDGHLIYFPFLPETYEIKPFLEKMVFSTPKGESRQTFQEIDPASWNPEIPQFDETALFSCLLSREILGDDIHIGSWVADGFSRAMQWFPSIEEAATALLTDPSRFRALVEYFDEISLAEAEAQVMLGGIESIQISSPYAGSMFVSLAQYKNLVLPSVSKIANRIHTLGAFSYIHTCGHISDRLEQLAGSGTDGIECMDPPPLGDVTLFDAKKRVGKRIFLKGNLDSVNVLLLGDDGHFEETVIKTIESGKQGGGFILSTACSVAPDVKPERLIQIREISLT